MVTQPSGIREPVGPGLLRLLRAAVLLHGTQERRRVFPATVLVGRPDRPGVDPARVVLDADVVTDHALRVDMVEALVRRSRLVRGSPTSPEPLPLVWVTRSGDLGTAQDVDLAWSAATHAAGGELGLSLAMVVVNRTGWRDPRSGVGRRWKRLRAS